MMLSAQPPGLEWEYLVGLVGQGRGSSVLHLTEHGLRREMPCKRRLLP